MFRTEVRLPIFFFLSNGIYAQSNGDYCADVERYNPRTGRESTYRLIVDLSDRKVIAINWPNGGHSDDFVPAPIFR